jgi:hypothetical protein
MCATSVIFKPLPKVKNHPLAKIRPIWSPWLPCTLALSKTQVYVPIVFQADWFLLVRQKEN